MTEKKPNHLLKQNSPYLVQHAYNPVDWYPWGNEALNAAREQNKLLVISIGYAACHWCHVMEHESFEDEEVAAVMNHAFISIKVDREERPDIDHIYMAAAYATSGRGGWPLNVIALADQRPLFAGTYYSKRDWIHILKYFTDLQHSNPAELLHYASEIGEGMQRQHQIPVRSGNDALSAEILHTVYSTWFQDLDFINGGTHGAPKFPMPANLDYLMKYGSLYQKRKAIDYVELTLEKMAMGGICDQLGGGFSRYSVDAAWRVPHFEKMLYDNAQLISLYSRAYTNTKSYSHKIVVENSIAFITREMTNPEGLFYASLDADSEGSEGSFYIWTNEEIRKYLGDDARLFLNYFSCEENGNWENNWNVLRKSMRDEDFAKQYNISVEKLTSDLDALKLKLFTVRGNRIRPATDDKILTSWNALTISALADASRAFDQPAWLEKAIVAAEFYRVHLIRRNGKLWRNAKSGSFATAGFLDDYCFLIKAFLDIYQSTLDEIWLISAEELTSETILHFTAGDGVFFRFTSDEEPELIQETIELSDNVIPASNSQMARNLFVLGCLQGREKYALRAEKMVKQMVSQVVKHPSFHANWASLLADIIGGPTTISILGEESPVFLRELTKHYLPTVIFSGKLVTFAREVSENHSEKGVTLIYICHQKTCFSPVKTVGEALEILGRR